MGRLHILACLGGIALLALAGRASAAEFPAITREERELTSVASQPNASAVVLFKKGKFTTVDPMTGRMLLSYAVTVRRKILTEEGKKYGEITLVHGKFAKLQRFEGRTVLPDGRTIPLPKDATFKRRASKSEKVFVTSIAFPSVEVGAILDYSYELRLDSLFYLEPWYFQEEVPTLSSEVVYEIPSFLGVNSWLQDPMRAGITREIREVSTGGWRISGQGKDLPPVPDEPHGVPLIDLAGYMMILPAVVHEGGLSRPLLKTWTSTCELFAPHYEKALRKAGAARRKATEIAGKAGGRRERAAALYRFVRDEIATDSAPGVGLPEDSTADSVLTARHGDPAQKALLLQAMLEAVDVPSRPVWAAGRNGGMVNLSYPNPWWFDRVILAAELDGERVYLDPADRSLGFGRLAPGLEGMPALLFSKTSPETVVLPATPFEQNLRRAKVDLEADGEGRLTGRGTLTLGGHHAWMRLHWKEDAGKTAKAWTEWLAEEYKGFTVGDVKVTEAVEDGRVEVAWTLAQREDEVLGDEVSLSPSRPLGPVSQAFQVPAARRISPVLFEFGDRDEVELTLRWPEGWAPETLPSDSQALSAAGSLTASVEVDEAARRLTYRRRFDLNAREYDKKLYGALQSLYAQTEKHDAQVLVLVRR